MSFVDYGLDIFPSIKKPGYHPPSGNYILTENTCDISNACHNRIINHLINLGSCMEKKLKIVCKELKTYQSLALTEEQILQLRKVSESRKSDCEHCMECKLRISDQP